MSLLRTARFGATVFALLAVADGARAQATDGYHAIQVLPVVVDTASFTQQIVLHNASSTQTRTVTAIFYPARGTALPVPFGCTPISLVGDKPVTFNSLRDLCRGLATVSNFGMLVLSSNSSAPFAVYSRVNNATGLGFSVEAIPANAFSSAATVVTGLRRSAATASAPAYQSNCFVAVLPEVSLGAPPAVTDIKVELRQDEVSIGSTVVSLIPGHFVRLLDVFAAVGDASGEYDHALAEFTLPQGGRDGMLSFCTVQDNTRFGADFRIGKQVQGEDSIQTVFDFNSWRATWTNGTPQLNGQALTAGAFSIPAGASANTHVYYFRHPDYVSCSLIRPSTGLPATPDYGLEMRLATYSNDSANATVLAGGNDVTGFSGLYLGDKGDRPNSGNLVYFLQVESNGQNEGSDRPYALSCRSGSGHTLGELVQRGAAVSF